MERIAIVTDSTADLPKDLANFYEIKIVPLRVIFGPEVFKDWVEMDNDAFWAKLATSPHHPKTSQPSPADFVEMYEKLKGSYDRIISIHLSSDLSGTFQSAQMAKNMVDGIPIDVFDSRSASMGLGLCVVEAARMVKAGNGVNAIFSRLAFLRDSQRIFLTVDSLDFFQKNGRIGKAAAFLGTILNVKPILTIEDGIVAPVEKVRGKKTLEAIINNMEKVYPAGTPLVAAFLHANAPDSAAELKALVEAKYPLQSTYTGSIGPVIATNTGPGTVGLVFYPAE